MVHAVPQSPLLPDLWKVDSFGLKWESAACTRTIIKYPATQQPLLITKMRVSSLDSYHHQVPCYPTTPPLFDMVLSKGVLFKIQKVSFFEGGFQFCDCFCFDYEHNLFGSKAQVSRLFRRSWYILLAVKYICFQNLNWFQWSLFKPHPI